MKTRVPALVAALMLLGLLSVAAAAGTVTIVQTTANLQDALTV